MSPRPGVVRMLATSALVLILAAGGASAALGADQAPLIGGTLYLVDAGDITDIAPGATLGYDDSVAGVLTPGDSETKFSTPAGASGIFSFLAAQGHEGDPAQWSSYTQLGQLPPDGVLLPILQPSWFNGNGTGSPSGAAAVRAAGGDYSLGIAFTTNSGTVVADKGLYFVHIHITAGTGEYTWQPIDPSTVGVGSPSSGGSGSSAFAGDGLLALSSVTPTGLAVHGGQQSSWTVTVTDGSGATRTLSTGAPGDSDVDIPSDAVTLTLVSG